MKWLHQERHLILANLVSSDCFINVTVSCTGNELKPDQHLRLGVTFGPAMIGKILTENDQVLHMSSIE